VTCAAECGYSSSGFSRIATGNAGTEWFSLIRLCKVRKKPRKSPLRPMINTL